MGLNEGSLVELSLKNGKAIMSPQVTLNRDIVTGQAKHRKQAFRELARVVAELRQEAEEKGINKMSKREINAAVALARRDLKKTSDHAGK
jgi:antitoxin component of MazEF toxin-antitoxin module